ncbi:MAG: ribonuclease P protein component [bacterium]|nr:ribonuclease P protein component [bacterium]
MPRKNSLTHADFVRAEKAKFKRERGALFILSFGSFAGQKTAEIKAGCVVSKKTAALAVARNRIKRRWRAAMKQCLSAVSAPAILVFYAMRLANTASYAEIKNDVEQLVARTIAKPRAL